MKLFVYFKGGPWDDVAKWIDQRAIPKSRILGIIHPAMFYGDGPLPDYIKVHDYHVQEPFGDDQVSADYVGIRAGSIQQ